MYKCISTIVVLGVLNGAPALAETYDAAEFPCLNRPVIHATIPGDTVLSDQQSFNCFAWQEFIAVNWPTKPGAGADAFGVPGDLNPVVFETYKNVHDLLSSDGTTPAAFDKARFLPQGAEEHERVLSRTSKLGNNFNPALDINEAAPSIAWLADRHANLVWYEIFVNEPEFDYFYENKFYNSMQQFMAATEGHNIDLPMGQVDGSVGAMEFKAAWLAVPDPEERKWQRYKLSTSHFCTQDEGGASVCTKSTIALIGLHIIHKTTSQPNWIWATFEHVDNVPDQSAVDAGALDREYTFYAEDCTERDVPEICTGGQLTFPAATAARKARLNEPGSTTSCKPNVSPAYALGRFVGGMVDPASPCQPYPVRATRMFALPQTPENPIVQTNAAARALIKAANPDSVYQNYQLINVMWSDSPVDENAGAAPPMAPLSNTAFRPTHNAFPVSNPVLETYVQNLACLDCHASATIASSILTKKPTFASDYSFIFGMAGPKRPAP